MKVGRGMGGPGRGGEKGRGYGGVWTVFSRICRGGKGGVYGGAFAGRAGTGSKGVVERRRSRRQEAHGLRVGCGSERDWRHTEGAEKGLGGRISSTDRGRHSLDPPNTPTRTFTCQHPCPLQGHARISPSGELELIVRYNTPHFKCRACSPLFCDLLSSPA